MRIAVNTGGGDAPGLNAVIRAVTVSALWRGWEVLGIRYGYRGLLEPGDAGVVQLDRAAVRGIGHLGGTILGSTNRGDPFRFPIKQPDGTVAPTDVSDRVVERLRELGVDALIAIGGDGSLRIARQLRERGAPRVIMVPKTIDNDLPGTDVTFGFDTAVSFATEALDRLHTTAQAHERVMVIEVMGRDAGWIALHTGVAGGADVILIPEIPFDLDRVAEKIARRERRGRTFSMVVVAEGAKPAHGERVVAEGAGAFKEHARLGGIAEVVAQGIAARTGKETRSVSLGHLLRGGSPVMSDRLLALQLGCAATRFLAEAKESGLTAIRGGKLVLVPLAEVPTGVRRVPVDGELVQAARDLGLCFGDEAPGTFLPPDSLRPVAG